MASNLGTVKMGLLMRVEDGEPVEVGVLEVPVVMGSIRRGTEGNVYTDVVLDWSTFSSQMAEMSQFIVMALAAAVGNDTDPELL